MKTIKKILKNYGVKLVFKKIDEIAYYSHSKNLIVIDKSIDMTEEELISIIFHELGHRHCFNNNLYYAYHNETDARLYKLTALKAERFVDKWAAKEMKKNGFPFEYPMFYFNKNRTKEFTKMIKSVYLDILAR
jgi:predicted aminopeptidase